MSKAKDTAPPTPAEPQEKPGQTDVPLPVYYHVTYDSGYSPEIHYVPTEADWKGMQEFGERVVKEARTAKVKVNRLDLDVEGGGRSFSGFNGRDVSEPDSRGKRKYLPVISVGITRDALAAGDHTSPAAGMLIQHELGHIKNFDNVVSQSLKRLQHQQRQLPHIGLILKSGSQQLANDLLSNSKDTIEAFTALKMAYAFRASLDADIRDLQKSKIWNFSNDPEAMRDYLAAHPGEYKKFVRNMLELRDNCIERAFYYDKNIKPWYKSFKERTGEAAEVQESSPRLTKFIAAKIVRAAG